MCHAIDILISKCLLAIYSKIVKKLTQVCTQLIAIQTHRFIFLITHMCNDVFFTNYLCSEITTTPPHK